MLKCPHCDAVMNSDAANQDVCLQCLQLLSTPTATVLESQPFVSAETSTAEDMTMPPDFSMNETAKTVQFSDQTVNSTYHFDAALATMPDQVDINPMATIVLGPSGITVGGSNAAFPMPPMGATRMGGLSGAGHGKTAKNTANDLFDSAIDFDRSILSTISKRSLAEQSDPLVSTPDYRIISKLGEGGMGVVYSAIQKTLERKVAVKAIKANKSVSEDSRRKFFYEAQITSDLDHPNIVPIHEMGSNLDGTLFYSMKMVDGTPWEKVIREKTREENIEILMKVCDAVAFAHSRNIIHRDLKPENVMLGAFGEVLVMDWGLAINLTTTKSFGLSGTPVYMAPEMACHDLSKIGKTSDIYIIGAILFQIVVGKAPHIGKSVRECMASAIKNHNIDPGFEDPLLEIAYHAMALEPEDRFGSVVEFQDAIRQHLRFAQSVLLTKRAEELLESSIRDKDYQGFSRALFSMQDAIDLWSENQIAIDGLQRTRIAYGQCAIKRGDYDLCLQTVDPSVAAESELYQTASKRKREVQQRETRFKILRRVLAAVILFSGAALTAATLYARRQTAIAVQEKAKAVEAADAEKIARNNEASARLVAIEERNRAQQAAEDEKLARKNEEAAKQIANAERDRAVEAQRLEQQAKILEIKAREQAVASEQVASQNARFALLGNYQSGINLALNQSNQFDIVRSEQLLNGILEIESRFHNSQVQPSLANWAYRRVQLLNNLDLPSLHLQSPIVSLQTANSSNRGVVGTQSGHVHVFEVSLPTQSLKVIDSIHLPGPVQSVTISPDGNQVLVATQRKENSETLYSWDVPMQKHSAIDLLGRREFQKVVFSPDGKWCVAGINGGLWVWDRTEVATGQKPFLLQCRGSLKNLQFVGKDTDTLFGLAELPNASNIAFFANLAQRSVQMLKMPEGIEDQVPTAVAASASDRIFLGTKDGRILAAAIDPLSNAMQNKARKVAFESDPLPTLQIVNEVLPRKHTTAIRNISLHPDGKLVSFGAEPVAHVWQMEPNDAVAYVSFLNGLKGNVTCVQFLESSDHLLGCDDLGNMIAWDVPEQESRRLQRSQSEQQVLEQTLSKGGVRQSIDRDGVLRSFEGNDPTIASVTSFIGHTPNAKITDFSLAATQPWIATIATIPENTGNFGTPANKNTEVCIWDLTNQTMMNRLQLDSKGACRIAFVNGDRSLVVGDGERTFTLENLKGQEFQAEASFGTAIAVAHPTTKSLSAYVASSGAVRMVDASDDSSWNNENYREFDIAINNRYLPIEAIWSDDGSRLYIVFENGRIARLTWNGKALGGLAWTEEIRSIQSAEQQEPWRFLDLSIRTSGSGLDQLQIVVRSSDATSECNYAKIDWDRNLSQAIVQQQPPFRENARILASEPEPVMESRLISAFDRNQWFDIKPFDTSKSIVVDRQGSVCLVHDQTAAPQPELLVGRPVCVGASQDQTQRRWVTTHELGVVLLACQSNDGDFVWQRVGHPFRGPVQACLSPDGQQLAIVGKSPNQQSKLMRWTIDEQDTLAEQKVAERDGVVYASWHPDSKELLVLDRDAQWSRITVSGDRLPVLAPDWSKNIAGYEFAELRWLQEPWLHAQEDRLSMAILSHGVPGSRIDFVALNPDSKSAFAPLVSASKITSFATSPNENLFAVGDENGTLGVWFAARSLDRGPRELFTLPGHRGASICQLRFSADGNEILSSDTYRQSIRWKSLPSEAK